MVVTEVAPAYFGVRGRQGFCNTIKSSESNKWCGTARQTCCTYAQFSAHRDCSLAGGQVPQQAGQHACVHLKWPDTLRVQPVCILLFDIYDLSSFLVGADAMFPACITSHVV